MGPHPPLPWWPFDLVSQRPHPTDEIAQGQSVTVELHAQPLRGVACGHGQEGIKASQHMLEAYRATERIESESPWRDLTRPAGSLDPARTGNKRVRWCLDREAVTGPKTRRSREMSKSERYLNLATRVGLVVATAVGVVGLNATMPASASTDNFGQGVYACAGVMLPYHIDSQGSITMTMPDGSTMHWRTFGEMVTYMRNNTMC